MMADIIDDIQSWQSAASAGELLEFYDRVCREYRQSDDTARANIRSAIKANSAVRDALLYDSHAAVGPSSYLTEAYARSESNRDAECYLRSALCAISLTDGFEDSRDTLVFLAHLWQDAQKKGVVPDSIYEEYARLSSDEVVHMIGGPTTFMIMQMLDPKRRDELTY